MYDGPPVVPFPVVPLQVWGLAYDLDLVVVSKHPSWDMHELARLTTPDGPLWLAKDARAGSLEQSIVADLPDIEAWLPEVPVRRMSYPVRVDDRSTADRLDLTVDWQTVDGEEARVAYRGKPPLTAQAKRNGSTMGHSRDAVLAVLDVSHRTFASSTDITIGGQAYRTDRILGLVPFRMALIQVQGGLAVGETSQEASEGGVSVRYKAWSGAWIDTAWTQSIAPDGAVVLEQADPVRTLRYRFRPDGDALELESAEVTQWGRAAPTVHVAFSPPLPDVRRPFLGEVRVSYVIDVNGQLGHAVGHVVAKWVGDSVVLDVAPIAPWWTLDRPLRATVTAAGAAVSTRTVRAAELAPR
jgi:hypothetical protein